MNLTGRGQSRIVFRLEHHHLGSLACLSTRRTAPFGRWNPRDAKVACRRYRRSTFGFIRVMNFMRGAHDLHVLVLLGILLLHEASVSTFDLPEEAG